MSDDFDPSGHEAALYGCFILFGAICTVIGAGAIGIWWWLS